MPLTAVGWCGCGHLSNGGVHPWLRPGLRPRLCQRRQRSSGHRWRVAVVLHGTISLLEDGQLRPPGGAVHLAEALGRWLGRSPPARLRDSGRGHRAHLSAVHPPGGRWGLSGSGRPELGPPAHGQGVGAVQRGTPAAEVDLRPPEAEACDAGAGGVVDLLGGNLDGHLSAAGGLCAPHAGARGAGVGRLGRGRSGGGGEVGVPGAQVVAPLAGSGGGGRAQGVVGPAREGGWMRRGLCLLHLEGPLQRCGRRKQGLGCIQINQISRTFRIHAIKARKLSRPQPNMHLHTPPVRCQNHFKEPIFKL